MNNIIRDMLLIEEGSVFRLYKEMIQIAGLFIGPLFIISIIIELFGNFDFGGVFKRLIIVILILSSFYEIHSKAVDLSLDTATSTLRKISPRNLFVKKWYEGKLKTKEKKGWGYLESIAIPNLNDLLATAFFLLAKVFTWLLKLIYSSVYHLTYVFSGITGLLYFFGWTNKSLVGTIQSSLWCIILPFVIVAILAMVGNSINIRAINGDLAIADIETILWLFGVTLILLLSPMITWSMVRGEGIAGAGAKMGAISVSSGMKAAYMMPLLLSKNSPVRKVGRKVANKTFSGARGIVNNLSEQRQYQNMVNGGDLGKETFLYDKKYWKEISPAHREGIRLKYGIETRSPQKGMVYYPAKSGTSPVPLKDIREKVKDRKTSTIKSNHSNTSKNSIKSKSVLRENFKNATKSKEKTFKEAPLRIKERKK